METKNPFSADHSQKSGFSVQKLCFIAMAIVLNVVGGYIALSFHLPIYLDSIGTILIAVLYGPVEGVLPPLIYGLVMGFTADIYSLYYMPVGMITGLAAGLVSRRFSLKGWKILPGALLITIPGTIVSSIITAVLFGGITSSGSSIIVQLLHKAGLNLSASVFIVQILTDFLDRVVSLLLIRYILRILPKNLIQPAIEKEKEA